MRVRWSVIWWIFLICVIAFMDRINFAVAVPLLMKEMHISATQVGLVMSAFGVGYLLTTLPGGLLADHFKANKVLAGVVILWSVATLSTGMAWAFVPLLVIRFLFGVFEGPLFPTNTVLTNKWVLPLERGSASGLWIAALMLGVFIGSPLSSMIITAWGWRMVFYIFAIVGLIIGILTPYVVAAKPEESKRISPEEVQMINSAITEYDAKTHVPTAKEAMVQLTRNPYLWIMAIIFFSASIFFWANVNWLPTYFVKARGVKNLSSGFLAGIPYLVAAFGPVVAVLSDKFTKGWRSPWLMAGFIIQVPCIIIAVNTPSLTISLVMFSIATFACWANNALFYAMAIDFFHDKAGTAMGIILTVGSIASIIAPTLVGYVLDKTGSFTAPYYICALGVAICIILVIFIIFEERRVRTARETRMAALKAMKVSC